MLTIAQTLMHELAQHPLVFYGFAAVVGLAVGSFLTAVSWRLPRGMDWVAKPSHCPSCQTRLGVRDLVPVVSWMLSHGRCRHCGVKVSGRYVAVELAAMAMALLPVIFLGLSHQALVLVLVGWLLLLLSVIDLEHMILPDGLNVLLGLGGVVYGWWLGDAATALIGAALGLGLALALKYGFLWLRKKDGLGMGDVKFFAAAGSWLGLYGWPFFLMGSGLAGILLGLFWQRLHGKGHFPFGPSLCAALWGWLWYGAMQ